MVFTSSGGGEVTLDINAEDNASGSIDEIAGSLSGMQGAAVAAGGALAAIGIGGLAKATGAAIDFEEAMVEVEKVTSTAVADSLEDDVRGVAESTRLAHGEVAELTAQAARFGAEGEEEIANFTETAAEMGASTTLASDEAGRALAKMSTALGVPLSDVRELGDATNELSNNFAANSQEIVDSSTRAGQSLQALGLQEDEILGLSAAMNEVSPSSSKAATMMRKLSNAMMEPDNIGMFADALNMTTEEFRTMREENPQEAMLQLGEAMNDSDEVSRAFADQLNKRQVRAFRRVGTQADTMRESQELATEAMEEGGSLAEENAADMDTFAGQMDKLNSRLTTAAQKIGEQVIPVLIKLIDTVMPAIDAFIEFNDATDGMAGAAILAGTAITGLVTAAAALAPLLSGTVIPALGSVAAVLTGPVGLAIAAIVAAVAGLWYAWDNNIGNIQDKVDKFVSSIQSSFGLLSDELNALKDVVTEAFTLSGEQTEELQGTIEKMSNAVGTALETIADVVNWLVVNHYEPMMKRIVKLTETHLGPMVDEFIETFNVVVDRAESFVAVFQDLWAKYGDQIMAIIKPILKGLRILFATVFDAIFTTVRVILALIRGDWEDAWNIMAGFVERQFDRIEEMLQVFKDAFTASWDLLTTLIEDSWDAAWGAVEAVLNGAVKALKGAVKGFVNWVSNSWDSFIDSLKQAWSDAWSAVEDTLTDAFNSMVSFITSIGRDDVYDAFYKVGKAIREVFTNTFDAIIGTGGKVKTFVSDVKTYIQSGAKKDIKQAFVTVMNAIEQTWDDMVTAVMGAGGTVKTFVSDTYTYIRTDAKEDLKNAFENALDAVKQKFTDLKNDVIGAGGIIKNIVSDIVTYFTSGSAYDDLKEATDNVTDAIMAPFEGLYDGLIGNSLIPDMFKDIKNYIKNTATNYLGNVADTAASAITGAFDSIASTIGGDVEDAMDDAKDFISDAIDNIIDDVEDMFDISIDGPDINWPEPPSIVEDAYNGALNIDWPDPPDNIPFTGNDNDGSSSASVEEPDDDTDIGSDNDYSYNYETDVDDGDTTEEEYDGNSSDDYSYDYEYDVGGNLQNDGSDDEEEDDDDGWMDFDFGGIPGADAVSDLSSSAIDKYSPFADGGIVTAPTAALIGEAGQNEAVLPLDQLSTMMDTTYNAGASASGGTKEMEVTLRVEGDDELARIIRDNAQVEIENNEQSKKNRLQRY